MTSRERFLAACQCRAVDRTPVWLMRQAGRALPEYRALRQKYSFSSMVQTPELAAEATLQPIRRFGFDAAILFSDILVIPEALGQPYQFDDVNGISMSFALKSSRDVEKLDAKNTEERLRYSADAIHLIRTELGDATALIGFGGSPWTLGNFMVEGGSGAGCLRLREWFYADRPLFDRLMRKLSDALIAHFELQIRAGVDALQIFDSLGGAVSDSDYAAASGRWISRIVRALNGKVPVIVFGRGVRDWQSLTATGADVLGIDWTISLAEASRVLPKHIGLQGNLDPAVLNTTPKIVRRETRRILSEMKGRRGHIFNLGHGVLPGAKLENIEALCETLRAS